MIGWAKFVNDRFILQARQLSDDELIAKARCGVKQAVDILIERYEKKTLSLVLRYIDDRGDALDVCQEIFIKLYRSLPSFKHDSSFFTWYYRIILNTIKNYYRSYQKREAYVDIDFDWAELFHLTLSERASPEQLLIGEQSQSALIKALDSMPDELCYSMILCDMEGLSYDEIAKRMGCPIGTVRSRIYRARHIIEKTLDY